MFEDQELKDNPMDRSPEGGEYAPLSQPAAAPSSGVAPRRRLVVLAVLVGLALAAAGTTYGRYWLTQGRYLVSTDDAYVGAKSATLSPKVSGYIAEVAVEDNAQVAAGDVIARIDPGDYQLAVANARDQIGVQQATIDRLGRQTT
ncbi:MAG TPA: biotin/lipoyl-binding protein, partial [Hyphomicrobiaceae bacterium]|nr:biotin/lipoyl-binding protein [Hyphomicrobiaceae bacterium]